MTDPLVVIYNLHNFSISPEIFSICTRNLLKYLCYILYEFISYFENSIYCNITEIKVDQQTKKGKEEILMEFWAFFKNCFKFSLFSLNVNAQLELESANWISSAGLSQTFAGAMVCSAFCIHFYTNQRFTQNSWKPLIIFAKSSILCTVIWIRLSKLFLTFSSTRWKFLQSNLIDNAQEMKFSIK